MGNESNKPQSLIQESSDAIRFVQKAALEWDRYKLFASETFLLVQPGILLTSGPDLQGEEFVPQALEEAVRHIKEEGLWMRYQHDPAVPPIGRLLDAGLFFAPQTGLMFVAGVFGILDPSSVPSFSKIGINTRSDYDPGPPPAEFEAPHLHVTLEYNKHEIAPELVAEMLQGAPPSVSKEPRLQFRKAADPFTIACFAIASWPLWANPFAKKFLERFGEEAANVVMAFSKWLGKEVAGRLKDGSRLVVSFNTRGCKVEFVLTTNEPSVVREASENVLKCLPQASQLISALLAYEPQRVVYLYDQEAKQWFPSFAETKKVGLIADTPKLISLEVFQSGGLSVGGSLERPDETPGSAPTSAAKSLPGSQKHSPEENDFLK